MRWTSRSDTVQRNGTPEAQQIEELLKRGTSGGALYGRADDPRAVAAISAILPNVPAVTIAAALRAHPIPTEALESLFLDQAVAAQGMPDAGQPTRQWGPLAGAQIAGQNFRWTIAYPLGSGTEANVYFAQSPVLGQAAVKIFKGSTGAHEAAFKAEVQAHERIRGLRAAGVEIPHVVGMLDYNTLLRAVVMERVTGEPLHHLMDSVGPDQRDNIRQRVAQALAATTRALAAQGLALADVQDRNIMYNRETGEIMFVDISLRPTR
jgi:tRNA A-37 threonylcarbamoyl transferase component Bud32